MYNITNPYIRMFTPTMFSLGARAVAVSPGGVKTYVCVYIYIYMYVYIYIYSSLSLSLYIYIYTYMAGVNMVLAEFVRFKYGLHKSCGIEC